MKKLFLLWIVILLVGCTSTAHVALDLDEEFDGDVILGINMFGRNMLGKIYEEDPKSNIVFSPLSCTTALAMLENGSSGESKTELRNLLGVDSDALMNETYYSLDERFNEISNSEISTPITISSNNSLWYNKNMRVQSDYEANVTDYFGAEIRGVDFSREQTTDEMNQWIDERTEGLIKKVIDGTNESDALYLINTLYFNGRWSSPFNKELTEKKSFYLSSGEEITVDMMYKDKNHSYYENKDFQMIRLGYNQSAMYVVLPKGDMGKFMSKYDEFQVSDYLEEMEPKKVKLSMPRYETSSNIELVPMLKLLGVETIFDSNRAQLDKMISSDDLAVSRIIQNARIIVDEDGTEAAAATAITVFTSALLLEDEPITMTCDRPFMFVIKDNKTQTDLFIGVIQNPNE